MKIICNRYVETRKFSRLEIAMCCINCSTHSSAFSVVYSYVPCGGGRQIVKPPIRAREHINQCLVFTLLQ